MRIAVVLLVACQQSTPAPAPSKPPVHVPAIDAQLDASDRPPARETYPELAAQSDGPGKFVRKPTAVLLLSARGTVDVEKTDLSTERRFVPVACSIAGKLATGKACGEIMPAHATIRTAEGPLVVSRSTKVFHDDAGEQDYKPPFGPECCMYNTCLGTTIPYVGKGKPEPRSSRFGVWPADADIDLQISTTAPVQKDLLSRYQRANILLATSDLDGDGKRERIVYEVWANDFGIDVVDEHATTPLYHFSCGNI